MLIAGGLRRPAAVDSQFVAAECEDHAGTVTTKGSFRWITDLSLVMRLVFIFFSYCAPS